MLWLQVLSFLKTGIINNLNGIQDDFKEKKKKERKERGKKQILKRKTLTGTHTKLTQEEWDQLLKSSDSESDFDRF